MSLDVYLEGNKPTANGSGIFVRESGRTVEITRAEWDKKFPSKEPVVASFEDNACVYNGNITHNLSDMAVAAGIYMHLWRPEEIGIESASELIEPLSSGLEALKADPAKFSKHNPPNGWGAYDGFCSFVAEYLEACKQNPHCTVRVWR